MPTQDFFDQFPPFPNDLPVLELPRLSYASLLQKNDSEVAALYDAAIDHGFFLLDLRDAPGGSELLRDMVKLFGIGKAFFDSDLDTKKAFKLGPGNVGYKPMGMIKYPDGREDLTEICAVSKDSILAPAEEAAIPAAFANERPFAATLCDRLHVIAMTIISGLAKSLEVDPETFAARHKPDEPSSTVLRFVHNPPQRNVEPTARQAQLMGHTDSGSLTVLFAGLGGLQVLPAELEDRPENWRWVRPEPRCAIINVGDALVQWTGGVLRSSFHRVLYAPGAQAGCERYSCGYFLKPSLEAPMQRIQEGGVVPRLTPSEVEEDRSVEPYHVWHQNKAKGILKGENNVKSRGGLGAKYKTMAKARAQQVAV